MTTVDKTSKPSRAVVTWRWITLLLAVSQLAAPAVTSAVAGDFLASGATNEALITPAGYAFGLWGVITVLSAITALAIVRYGFGAWWELGVLIDLCIVFTGFSVWLLIAAQDWLWTSVVVFLVMAGALVHVMRKLVRHPDQVTCPSRVRTLATVTFGLYLGWSSIAIFANVAAALIYGGWSSADVAWQFVVLALAAVSAVVTTVMLRGTIGYVVGVLWALVAIAIGAAERGNSMLASTAAFGAVAVLLVAVLRWQRSRGGATDGPITA
ncbi:hypothetical protein [Mycolicibacterium lacusdiani]|uniref:hypothetical protein n=1 Tax=Mycolicibacterium lacusdiani TaxID=2895283 RepID=UPI001F40290F|nr:hypothetical protein [Mycolicibacterium lacusdiani]